MGKRLTRIYTRTGDDGTTGLADGSRVPKDAPRVEALGDVDELNSVLGLLLAEALPDALGAALEGVQHDLFDLGAELAVPGGSFLDGARVPELERWLDRLNGELPPLEEFILPGGGRAAALCHQARAVCRRAERRLIALAREEAVSENARHYLNRLSDLLFVAARILAREAGGREVLWRPAAERKRA
jgi:cob(I)alamin adenosyltransferase